ncbi:MAG: hypothetical protein CFE39_13215 [Comamonadaceae bacterium PBBC2]|nr:MAG: hypothetical protein CFE39_13215 [Comamonadaceae bacterium PBBC2]
MKRWARSLAIHIFGGVIACLSLSLQAAQPQPAVKPQPKKAAKTQPHLHKAASLKVQAAKAPAKSAAWVKPAAVALPLMAGPAALAAMPSMDISLSDEAMAIAERVHKGHLPCELGAFVRVESDESRPGFFHLHGKGFRYHMHPVSTSTGAIRLEDKKAGAVWLQLANKSMLMDQKRGRRMADECAHPEQMAFAQDMKHNPPPKLFDTTGMGR